MFDYVNLDRNSQKYSINYGASVTVHDIIDWVVLKIQNQHVNKIPTMQFFTGFSRNTQSKSYMLSLT